MKNWHRRKGKFIRLTADNVRLIVQPVAQKIFLVSVLCGRYEITCGEPQPTKRAAQIMAIALAIETKLTIERLRAA